MAEATFEIQLGVAGETGVSSAATAVENLSAQLEGAEFAAEQAASALRQGEAAYKAQEAATDRAAKALEKINVAMSSATGTKLQNLVAKQQEAAAAADKAKVALQGEAATLDHLKASAAAATAQETKLSQVHLQAAKTAEIMAKAQEKAQPTRNLNTFADGLKKLGGPLGKLGDLAGDTGEGVDKLGGSLGSAGVALGIYGAIATAVTLAGVGLAKATASVLTWGVALADTNEDLDRIKKKFNDSIAKTFGGLKIDGLLKAIESLVDLFDESTASGKAMKAVFESIFQPMIDGAAAFIPKIRSAFIQFEILVLKALIAIKPFGSTIVLIGEGIGVAFLAVVAVIAVVVGFILTMSAAAGTLVVGLGYLGVKLIGLVADGIAFAVSWVSSIGGAFDWVKQKVSDAFAYLSSLSLAQIGTDLINGLVQGIMNGGAAVLGAITGIVGGAIDGAKKLLGIASPSKVFAEIGMNTGAGMAQGVDVAAGQVQGSLESMVSPPDASAGAAPAASSAGGNTFTINITAPGGAADDIASAVREVLLQTLEGDVSQLAAAVPG